MSIPPQHSKLVGIFATNVRHFRNEIGLSQEALAERAGVHRTYVGMLERGEKNVTIYNIERIAEALNVEPSKLLEQSTPSKRKKN